MVYRKKIKQKYALISVFEKKKLNYLCKNLSKYNYNFISSGSTGQKIRQLGFKCKDLSKLTKFKEMFDGRIKTINPLIYSSLLYIRDNENHQKQFLSLRIPKIDIVVVNLYPFSKFVKKNDHHETIEMIDIGGPSLLRAASKNYKFVTPIMDTADYEKLIKNIKNFDGNTNINFRKKMAAKVFKNTYKYDKIIFEWFNERKKY